MNSIHPENAPNVPEISSLSALPSDVEPDLVWTLTTSEAGVPGFLFCLAAAALDEGYPVTAAHQLAESASCLAAAAQHAQATQTRTALLASARLIERATAGSAHGVEHRAQLNLIFAYAQLTLAYNLLHHASLAWSRHKPQRAGCYLDSTIHQLTRAQAWIDHRVPRPEDDSSMDSDAQRIADALAEGWTVRCDRVNELFAQLDQEICALAGTLHTAMNA